MKTWYVVKVTESSMPVMMVIWISGSASAKKDPQWLMHESIEGLLAYHQADEAKMHTLRRTVTNEARIRNEDVL